MRYSVKPNHLADLIDHQKSAASSLPPSLMTNIIRLQQLTQEITTLLDNCLPQDMLQTLKVGSYADNHLVLSVQSQTAANHLRYQSNNLIHILKEQSITFSQLKNIDVIVTYPSVSHRLDTNKRVTTCDSKAVKSIENEQQTHNLRGLTESTKRTIAYTAKHVIKDATLKKCLENLLKG